MWAIWIVVAVAVVAVAVLYRRSVQKARRQGHQLRGSGDYMRFKRDVRRDAQAFQANGPMATLPPRRAPGDDRPPND